MVARMALALSATIMTAGAFVVPPPQQGGSSSIRTGSLGQRTSSPLRVSFTSSMARFYKNATQEDGVMITPDNENYEQWLVQQLQEQH